MLARPRHICRDRNRASPATTSPRPTQGEDLLPGGTVRWPHRFCRLHARQLQPRRSCRNFANPRLPSASPSLAEPEILFVARDAGPGYSPSRRPDRRGARWQRKPSPCACAGGTAKRPWLILVSTTKIFLPWITHVAVSFPWAPESGGKRRLRRNAPTIILLPSLGLHPRPLSRNYSSAS